jgi:signal transduction histidine kinase
MTLLSSLTNRIFIASALLVSVPTGITIARVNVSVSRRAEDNLRAGLAEASSLVDQFSRTQFSDFVVKAELIAGLPVLMGATATDDPATVQPIAEAYQVRIGADLFAVAGRGDRVLARAGRIRLTDDEVVRLIEVCRESVDGTTFQLSNFGLLHVVAIPLEGAPGTLVAGVSLDRDSALTIKAVTNSEIAFVTGNTIAATSLDAERVAPLVREAVRTDVFTVLLGNEQFIARVQPLAGSGRPGPVAIVLRSRTEHLQFLSSLRWQIALTGLAAVIGATLLGYLIARTVTRPLRALTRTMAEMAATGDLARSRPAPGRWDDEDVRLVATTFDRLTTALKDFQREAALRERLSSLGRLSAAVAHEIRNPLMIIKSIVRGLRRSSAPDVADAAASLDEEVARLNRVVTSVLDFTQPMSIELSTADLGAICRDAVQAVEAAGDDVSITVDLPGGAVPCVTDPERLRAVLVNVLNNAQHAVRARPDPASSDGASVTLQAARRPQGGWRIAVIDRGVGIGSTDLSGIFDPFFTRRPGGSGLGLAISKNLVEALGGTIAADSRPGEGTTIVIELPDRALPAEART